MSPRASEFARRRRNTWATLACAVSLCAVVIAQPPPDRPAAAPPRGDGPRPEGVRPGGPPPDGEPFARPEFGRPPGPPGPFGPPGGPPGGPRPDRAPAFFRRLDNPMNLFRPLPADLRPAAPGEVDDLLNLAVQKVPRFGLRLREAQRKRPMLFQRRFEREFMPLLRQLKRIYDQDDTLGDLYRNHWQLSYDLRQLRDRMGDAPADQRERLEGEARKLFAAMIKIETDVAGRELEKRETNADAVADGLMTDVLSPDYDALAEPPPIREAIRAVREAKSDADRDAARRELRARVRRAVQMEIGWLRDLRDRLKDRGPDEVDMRIERFKNERRRPPFWGGPPGSRPFRDGDGPPDRPRRRPTDSAPAEDEFPPDDGEAAKP